MPTSQPPLQRLKRKLVHYHSALGFRGVVLFVYSKITGVKPVVKVTCKDIKHPFFLRIGSTDISTYKQVLVERHYEFSDPKAADFIIDGGANIGLASIYFANRFPNARIIAIEPEASNFEMLKRNTQPYPGIKPLRAALWKNNEELNLFDSGQGNHGFRIDEETHADGGGMGLVPGLTVEGILDAEGVRTVDILKIDIEGAELEVMESSGPWIDRVGALMIELHDDIKPGCSDAFYNATKDFCPERVKGETVMRLAGKPGAAHAATTLPA